MKTQDNACTCEQCKGQKAKLSKNAKKIIRKLTNTWRRRDKDAFYLYS